MVEIDYDKNGFLIKIFFWKFLMVIAFIIWSFAFFIFYAYSKQWAQMLRRLIWGQCSRFIAKRTFNCLMLTLNSLRSHWKCSNWKAQTDSDSIMSLFLVTIMWVWPMWLVCKSDGVQSWFGSFYYSTKPPHEPHRGYICCH